AIESGAIQRDIQESAYRAQVAIDAGDAVVVGVNRFVEAEREGRSGGIPLFQVDPAVERGQVARLQALRASRSAGDWERALSRTSQTARDGETLVPPMVDAVEAKATVGEIADALRAVFGVYQEPATT